MINKLIEKYNNLEGKEVTRNELVFFTRELFDFLPESNVVQKIYNKISNLLDSRKEDKFKISLSEKFNIDTDLGLNAPRHEGLAKEGLTECGRLKPGYKYVKGGEIVKIKTKTKASKKKDKKEVKSDMWVYLAANYSNIDFFKAQMSEKLLTDFEKFEDLISEGLEYRKLKKWQAKFKKDNLHFDFELDGVPIDFKIQKKKLAKDNLKGGAIVVISKTGPGYSDPTIKYYQNKKSALIAKNKEVKEYEDDKWNIEENSTDFVVLSDKNLDEVSIHVLETIKEFNLIWIAPGTNTATIYDEFDSIKDAREKLKDLILDKGFNEEDVEDWEIDKNDYFGSHKNKSGNFYYFEIIKNSTFLKKRILELKTKIGLKGYSPEITNSLKGGYLADGHQIMDMNESLLYDMEEAEGLNAAAKDVEQIVNELILEKIKTGEKLPPWKQTWSSKSKVLAQNFETKKEYTGSNSVILNILLGSIMPTPYYLTAKQIKSLGGAIKKGAKTVPLVYYNFIYKLKDLSSNSFAETELLKKVKGYEIKRLKKKTIKITAQNYTSVTLTEKEVKYLNLNDNEYISKGFLRYYRVFNVADTTGIDYSIPEPGNKTPKERIEAAESIVKSFKDKPKILPHDENAFYTPAKDTLSIPSINNFDNSEEYYSTLFHELVHSTMHESRLDRGAKYKNKEKDAQYAFEELIAELGASYLCGLSGILESTHINQASYLKGWHEKLQKHTENHSDFFVFATREAQKAVNYIIKDWNPEEEGVREEPKYKIGDKFLNNTNNIEVTITEIIDNTYRISPLGKKGKSDDFTEFKTFERYVKDGAYTLIKEGNKPKYNEKEKATAKAKALKLKLKLKLKVK